MSNDSPQNTLRDVLTANLEAASNNELNKVQDSPPIIQETDEKVESVEVQSDEKSSLERSRDEKGRFANKQEEQEEKTESISAAENVVEPTANIEQPTPRPTTWKKEYLPIWDKIASGAALTPDESKKLAAYNVQREREFATGVSTYRQEAQNAKHLTEALAPFVPVMQEQRMNPVDFIKNLGTTYAFLVKGTPQQKLHAFAKLAQDVGIPLQAIAQTNGGQLDPIVPQLMQHIQKLESRVNTVTGWREQQEEKEVQGQIAKFENNPIDYPHFQVVRGTMGRLLESGFAQDLESAYAKAVRMTDEVWQSETERQAPTSAPATQPQDKAAAAAAAKAKAVSVRSATPTGTSKAVDAKDIGSLLRNGFNSTSSGRV